jgi:signal transduction histidine kinase
LLSGSPALYPYNSPGEKGRADGLSMHRFDRPAWIRYGVALLCVTLATAMRFALDGVLRDDHQFSTFYLAVIVAAWFGGAGPAMLATTLGGLIGHYFFVAPRFSFAFAGADDVLGVAIFFILGLSICIFSGLLRQALWQAKIYADRLKRSEQEKARLYDEARQANEAKDRFLAIVSHELRTPVGGILLWSKLLRSQTLDEREREEAVEKIIQCAEDQSHLVNDLLDTSRIVHGKMHTDMVPLNLTTVVESTAEAMRAEAQARQIDLRVAASVGVLVRGDPIRLRQVVSNLLTNALKFTPLHGHVQVGLTCEHEAARIRVTDDGEGMGPEYLKKAFDRFSQGDGSLERKYGGLGLGLSIVKDIVDLHGGSIRAESEGPGRGARFTVTLPLLAETEGVKQEPAALQTN